VGVLVLRFDIVTRCKAAGKCSMQHSRPLIVPPFDCVNSVKMEMKDTKMEMKDTYEF
jgi:hypothetical protein